MIPRNHRFQHRNYVCGIGTCQRGFKNPSGCTQHCNAAHTGNAANKIQVPLHVEGPRDGLDIQLLANKQEARSYTAHHPILDGM